ncbi:hypothetical protein M1116_02360 [Patescibacteria group bacterium]|nr:hypothetical protein [Patescibacteria group bacterium]
MNALTVWLSLLSIGLLAMTAGGLLGTGAVYLEPDDFLRLHELIQIAVILPLTIVIAFMILRTVTGRFQKLQNGLGIALGVIFFLGIYFYAVGNGIHEVTNFFLNSYCDLTLVPGTFCRGLAVNDFYLSNLFIFGGAYLVNLSLIILERMAPVSINGRELILVAINSLILAAIIAINVTRGTVAISMVYALLTMITTDIFFLFRKVSWRQVPLTLYLAIAYTIGGLTGLGLQLR